MHNLCINQICNQKFHFFFVFNFNTLTLALPEYCILEIFVNYSGENLINDNFLTNRT